MNRIPAALSRVRSAALLVVALIAAHRDARGQATPLARDEASPPVFEPLLADPKEPQFFAAYLLARSPHLASRVGSVGFGQTIELLSARDWQLAVAAGVFSQFDMQSATTDLMNTDYLVGLPLSYRRGGVAARVQLYHQSSHLGDGYLAHTHAQRVTYSFEAAELLLSEAPGSWRLYGGGEYTFVHTPEALKPGLLHGGVEYHPRGALFGLGHFAVARWVTGLDARSVEDHAWQVGWSVVTGLEFADPLAPPTSGWRWSALLKAYTGPSPYGQFYRDHVSSVGLAVGFAP